MYLSNNTNKQVSGYHERKMLKSNITKITSILVKSEKNIAEYEKEKQDILRYMESNHEYDEQRYKRLDELKKLIEFEENNWIQAEEKKAEYQALYLAND